MINLQKLLALLTMVSGMILFSVVAGLSETEIQKKACFVDFDGDGIDDNIPDEDGDGIPNSADPDFTIELSGNSSEATNQEGFVNFGAQLKASGLAPDLATTSEKFGRRMFCARALSQNRCGFTSEEGFGAESGIGIGTTGGGGCAGGVCR